MAKKIQFFNNVNKMSKAGGKTVDIEKDGDHIMITAKRKCIITVLDEEIELVKGETLWLHELYEVIKNGT
jgi:hypothetical protein